MKQSMKSMKLLEGIELVIGVISVIIDCKGNKKLLKKL